MLVLSSNELYFYFCSMLVRDTFRSSLSPLVIFSILYSLICTVSIFFFPFIHRVSSFLFVYDSYSSFTAASILYIPVEFEFPNVFFAFSFLFPLHHRKLKKSNNRLPHIGRINLLLQTACDYYTALSLALFLLLLHFFTWQLAILFLFQQTRLYLC